MWLKKYYKYRLCFIGLQGHDKYRIFLCDCRYIINTGYVLLDCRDTINTGYFYVTVDI